MIEIALAGCPSSGKSTFFKAATLKDVKIASYPFTTLEPNEGIAHVTTKCPCRELKEKGHKIDCKKCIDGTRFVPIKLWDVAGLVPDAHLGRGRGIAFLDDIRQAQALIHVIDVSGKTDIEGNPSEEFDPSEAVTMLEREFNYWMINIFKKDWSQIQHQGEKEFLQSIEKRFSGLGIGMPQIISALMKTDLQSANFKHWTDANIYKFVDSLRCISKPSVIAANKIDISSSDSNLEKLKQKYHDKSIIPTSGDFEIALREANKIGLIRYIPGSNDFDTLDESKLNDKQKAALNHIRDFLHKHGSTGVQNVINEIAFKLLDLIVVYPVADPHKFTDKESNVLPDAFLLRKGSTALQLAFAVHEDIGKKFIAALDARTGKNVSADYQLKDGDVISIKAGR